MDARIKHLRGILFCRLRRTGKNRYFLSADAANKHVVSVILSWLDNCNSLLTGLPGNKLNKRQNIQTHTALLVLWWAQACECDITAQNTPLASSEG